MFYTATDPVFVVLMDNVIVGRLYYRHQRFYGYPQISGNLTADQIAFLLTSTLETADIDILGEMVYRQIMHPGKFYTRPIKKAPLKGL